MEAFVVNAIALAFSLTLVQLLLPSFNNWLAIELTVQRWSPGEILLFILAVLAFMVLASGCYPAMVLASLTPSGALIASKKSGTLRKVLITFQFCAAIILSITAVVIHNQVEHMRSKELGVNIDDVLVLKSLASVEDEYINDSSYFGKLSAFKQLIKDHTDVKGVTVSSNVPGTINSFFGRMRRKQEGVEVPSYLTRVDEEFAHVYGLELLAGRFFQHQDFSASQDRLVINESAALALGFDNPEEAIGIVIPTAGQREIIGVIADYHNLSPKHPIEPSLFAIDFGHMTFISVHFSSSGADIPSMISAVQSAWQEVFPEKPFHYDFLKDRFKAQYDSDRKLGMVMSGFTVLSLLIGCFGLFALALFTGKKRSKEIGIRKVLGAPLIDILSLLSLDFLKLSLIAVVVAIPIGYFISSKWLDGFHNRIDISWELLILPTICVISLGVLVIILQSLKTATQNPVDSLRDE